jgi:hypothetical protein
VICPSVSCVAMLGCSSHFRHAVWQYHAVLRGGLDVPVRVCVQFMPEVAQG